MRDVKDQRGWLNQFPYFKHVGIYAYRKDFLNELTRLPVSELEKAEKLEQLRVLENGYRIRLLETEYESMSVDTPEDLERVNQISDKKKL